VTSQADRQRAREGLREALRGLNVLETAGTACPDPELRQTLAAISRNRQAQTQRLLQWLTDKARTPEPMIISAATGDAGGDMANAIRVQERRDVTSRLMIVRVNRPEGFTFTPGQSVKLGLQGVRRPFSIASAPHEPWLEFFAELAPGGAMSGRLRVLKPGDTVTLGKPSGNFLLDRDYSRHLMIATVTGISPFLSMVRDAIHHGRRDHAYYLLHGASYHNEFGYREELERLSLDHPGILSYIPTVSRPDDPANAGWSGERGRVGDIVDRVIARHGLDPASTRLYACGHPAMVDAMEQTYRPRGYAIRTERYG